MACFVRWAWQLYPFLLTEIRSDKACWLKPLVKIICWFIHFSITFDILVSILIYLIKKLILLTNDSQFGFKRKHGTKMCISAFKKIVSKYRNQNSTIFVCFLDASKAFDRVTLRGVPRYLIRILVFWYAEQTMMVRSGDAMSEPFHVTNGVR